jgi:hypothetical protein
MAVVCYYASDSAIGDKLVSTTMNRMRYLGLFLCITGALLLAAGAAAFPGNGEGNGALDWMKLIVGVLLGLGVGGIGLVIYLIDLLLRVFRNRESFSIRLSFRILGVEFYQELGSPSDDDLSLEDAAPTG